MPESPVPNLDALSRSELGAFVEQAEQARNLWGGRRGGVRVTALLRSYALHKASAICFRLAGEIPQAVADEQTCERIYGQLPVWARW